MNDIRIPPEAVEAVKWFIGNRGLRLRWWKPTEDSLPSVQGSEKAVALVDGFLSGWLTVQRYGPERAETAERQLKKQCELLDKVAATLEKGLRDERAWSVSMFEGIALIRQGKQ